MSGFGSEIKKRIQELEKQGQNVPQIIREVSEGATIAAVARATESTPPNGAAIAGTGTRSGDLAQHWAIDSQTKPVRKGNRSVTKLANNMQYASYVNDGHRVDKHFVPGLIANGGMLERAPAGSGGLMVGVKTTFVPGMYIKEKAIKKYRKVVKTELRKRVERNFK